MLSSVVHLKKVCFIAYGAEDLCNLGVNAFRNGLQKSGFNDDLHVYVTASKKLNYEVAWITGYFEQMGCELIASNAITNGNTYLKENVFNIGDLVDERILGGKGKLTLTSTVVHYQYLYMKVFNYALNGTLRGTEFIDDYGTGTVNIAPFSGNVDNGIRRKVLAEEERMLATGPSNYIFMGPVYDNSDVLKVPPGAGMYLCMQIYDPSHSVV